MILLGILALYTIVITFVYAVLGAAKNADEIADYQYKRDFGHESRKQ